MKRHGQMLVDVTYPTKVRPDPVEQRPLLALLERPVGVGELTIQERFAAFHAANPGVLAALRELALAEAAAGARRISVKWLYERLRRETPSTAGREPWVLNNDFTSRYADLLAEDGRLAGLIERRTRKAE